MVAILDFDPHKNVVIVVCKICKTLSKCHVCPSSKGLFVAVLEMTRIYICETRFVISH